MGARHERDLNPGSYGWEPSALPLSHPRALMARWQWLSRTLYKLFVLSMYAIILSTRLPPQWGKIIWPECVAEWEAPLSSILCCSNFRQNSVNAWDSTLSSVLSISASAQESDCTVVASSDRCTSSSSTAFSNCISSFLSSVSSSVREMQNLYLSGATVSSR